jgi:hypothetical protein
MAAALSATASRAVSVRVIKGTKLAVSTPCVVVKTYARGRFQVVSCAVWQQ